MKVLLITNGESLDSLIDKRFGHGEYMIIVDTKTGESKTYKNIVNSEPQYGLGFFLNEGIDAVVVGNIGPNSFERLQEVNIPVYIAKKLTAKEALDKILSGELQPASEPTLKHSVHEGHGVGQYHDDREETHSRHHHDHEHEGTEYGRGRGEGRGLGRGLGRGDGRGAGRGMGQGRGRGYHRHYDD